MTAPQQQKIKVTGPVVVTANRLSDGAVVYRTRRRNGRRGSKTPRWSRPRRPRPNCSQARTADDVGAVGAYIAPVQLDGTAIKPGNLRERIRLQGPTFELPASVRNLDPCTIYDDFDRTLVAERVSEFRDQVARRLSGELTEEEFKPLRLMNGVYLQLHAYMLRIAIPYGTLSSDQMRTLAHVARRYDRNYGHFTTRQNLQFNWIKLDELPDAMADLARAGLHGMQTSGNCVRNITTDQWAGVAPDEIEDPRIWAEILRQHSTMHPEFSFLPRKFKIAITAATHDRAAIRVHDIGLRLHRNGAGETGFEVIVGGGLGRTPFVGKTIKPFLHKRDLLSYVEAILRAYNQYGRRDNIYKARIKILVHELGRREIRRRGRGRMAEDQGRRAGARSDFRRRCRGALFAIPIIEKLTDGPADLGNARKHDAEFERWFNNSVSSHKVAGYSIVTLSLKPEGAPPGDATAEQMDIIADLADQYSFGEIRVGHEQNLVLPHVAQRDLYGALAGACIRSASRRRMSDWSRTSSRARASTIAALPIRARSPWRRN